MRPLSLFAALLLAAGLVVRLLPLATDARTVAATSEDGYLMLTVARNVALGRGLSIAEGTIPTNGVQPAVTLVWAGVHALAGGDRLTALRGVLVVELILALVAAWAVAALARRSLGARADADDSEHPFARSLAWLAAGLWLAAPLLVRHTGNGLETGAVVLGAGLFLLAEPRWRAMGASGAALTGVALGVLFLVRNDAVFLAVAWAAVGAWCDGWRAGRWGAWLRNAVLAGLAALAVALPWLLYNLRTFGHIVPISGRAQSLNVTAGENLVALPHALAEYAWLWTPLPSWLATAPRGALLATAGLAVLTAVLALSWRRAGLAWRREWTLLVVGSAVLAAYYGGWFGASYFLSRYLVSLSLVGAVAWAAVLVVAARESPRAAAGLVVVLAGVMLVALARHADRAASHPHLQAVRWVEAHVPPSTWVGAPQSGTLGYFHDRTINLDGKVNPDALRARASRRLFAYIVDDTPIQYLVDWMGLARWIEAPPPGIEEREPRQLADRFEVLVKDPAQNLAVLRRRAPDASQGR